MTPAKDNFAQRLRRMLVMVPWLLQVGDSTVSELAARFQVGEDDIIRDLELVMCCGVPPYTSDQMVSVVLDEDGSVMAWKGQFFTRPMRLTPREGFSLLAAGRALMAVPGADPSGPLATALTKLEKALGSQGTVAVDLEAPPLLAAVRRAADEGQRLRVTYYSAWRDDMTERVIDPHVVFSREGRWYVAAQDSRSGTVRHFRVDRLRSAERTGESFVPPGDRRPPEQVFSGRAETTEVELVLPGSARWVAEAYDVDEVEDLGDGRFRVRLQVAGERWLERLLLRAGPAAAVTAPPELSGLAAAAARRVLARYG